MQKKRNVTEFFFPKVTDLASVKEKDIKTVLPAAQEYGSISRQRSSLKFDYDFFFFNVYTSIVNQRILLSTVHACNSIYVTDV